MDFLEANKHAIEEAIDFRGAGLLNAKVELIFYDTPSLHFEIDKEDAGAKQALPGPETAGLLEERAHRCAADRGRARRDP